MGVPTSARMCTETGQACVCSRTCLLKVARLYTQIGSLKNQDFVFHSETSFKQTNTHKHTATLTNVDFLPYYSWHALTRIILSPSLIHTHTYIYMRAHFLSKSWRIIFCCCLESACSLFPIMCGMGRCVGDLDENLCECPADRKGILCEETGSGEYWEFFFK